MDIKIIGTTDWLSFAKGIKFPTNDDWGTYFNKWLNKAIKTYKTSTSDEQAYFRDDSRKFLTLVGFSSSIGDIEYINPGYAHITLKDILKVEGKYFTDKIRQIIIIGVFEEEEFREEISYAATDGWVQTISASSVEGAYRAGKVSREFAYFVNNRQMDKASWEALDIYFEGLTA